MHNPQVAVAWFATFGCLIFSMRIATAFLRGNPRMFTVMTLLACAWGLLLPYYSDQKIPASAELFAAFAGFLFVYVGGLLMLQAQTDRGHHAHEIVPLQIVGLWLLLLIAGPSLPSIRTPNWSFDFFGARDQAYLVVGTALDLTGFFAIALGVKSLFHSRPFAVVAATLTCYGALDIAYTYWAFYRGPDREMPALFAYSFAAIKIIFTLVFGCLVAHYGMSPATRDRGVSHWIRLFFGLDRAYADATPPAPRSRRAPP